MYRIGMTTATENGERVARLCHALADETRLRVLERLSRGEQCVCDLQESIGVGQSLLSFHLKVLRESGLVDARKDGRWVHYSLRADAVEELAAYVGTLRMPDGTWKPCDCGPLR